MANFRHIAFALVASIVLLVGIGLWIGYRTGEVALVSSSNKASTGTFAESLPGPLTSLEETAATNTSNTAADSMNTEGTKNPKAVFHTSEGDITLELYADAMPITVGNFVKLATENFYDGTKFHRVIRDFMIQGGDPNSKGADASVYGRGGPGYTIQDEFITDPRLTNVRGTIAMANTGQPNSGGSQFFINLVDNTNLDFDKPPMTSRHPVFGKVVGGMNIVDAIGVTETGGADVPVKPIVITDIEIQ